MAPRDPVMGQSVAPFGSRNLGITWGLHKDLLGNVTKVSILWVIISRTIPLMGRRRTTPLRDILAEALRRWGERSQRQFASQLGIGRSTYNRIEMGEENVTINTLDTICLRLGVSIGELFGDTE